MTLVLFVPMSRPGKLCTVVLLTRKDGSLTAARRCTHGFNAACVWSSASKSCELVFPSFLFFRVGLCAAVDDGHARFTRRNWKRMSRRGRAGQPAISDQNARAANIRPPSPSPTRCFLPCILRECVAFFRCLCFHFQGMCIPIYRQRAIDVMQL